jgi:arylsulfatase
MHHMDWLPTFVAMAGDPNIKENLKKKKKRRQKGFRVHLDGYNFLPYLTGAEAKPPRKEIFYFSDDGDLTAGNFLQTFKEFPPRQKAASFTVDQAMQKLKPQAH